MPHFAASAKMTRIRFTDILLLIATQKSKSWSLASTPCCGKLILSAMSLWDRIRLSLAGKGIPAIQSLMPNIPAVILKMNPFPSPYLPTITKSSLLCLQGIIRLVVVLVAHASYQPRSLIEANPKDSFLLHHLSRLLYTKAPLSGGVFGIRSGPFSHLQNWETLLHLKFQ